MGKRTTQIWAKTIQNKKAAIPIFIVLFSGLGLITLLYSHASTPSVSVESSAGELSGGARNFTDDASASSSNYVKFLNGDTAGVTIAAAGDIACGEAACRQNKTGDLIRRINPDAVLLLGDNAYKCGKESDFRDYYAPHWGSQADDKGIFNKTYPVPGNHEYNLVENATKGIHCLSGETPKTESDSAKPYFDYFRSRLPAGYADQRRSWYKFSLGNWKIYALDSQCFRLPDGTRTDRRGCDVGSVQYEWLKSELESDRESPSRKCTMAFWHIPMRGLGKKMTSLTPGTAEAYEFLEDNPEYKVDPATNTIVLDQAAAADPNNAKPLWRLLYDHKADVVLNGHQHSYQRFHPMNREAGGVDTVNGITEIMAGVGGQPTADYLSEPYPPVLAAWDNTHQRRNGVLKATLGDSSMDFAFVSAPIAGDNNVDKIIDSGTVNCH